MSYTLYDSRGYVADVASSGGWSDFRRQAAGANLGAETRSLIDEGCSDDPEDLAAELESIAFKHLSADGVRRGLVAALKKCRDVAIITDGCGFADENAAAQKSDAVS